MVAIAADQPAEQTALSTKLGLTFPLVSDPDLKLDQLEQVQRDVARLLETGLPAEPQPTEEPFVPEMTVSPKGDAVSDEAVSPVPETGPESTPAASP